MGSKATEEMAHPKIVEPVEPIREFKIDNSTPPNETDVPVLDDNVYGIKFDKYIVEYKDTRENKPHG